jgi:hypothetical protein
VLQRAQFIWLQSTRQHSERLIRIRGDAIHHRFLSAAAGG